MILKDKNYFLINKNEYEDIFKNDKDDVYLYHFIYEYENIVEEFRNNIPFNIYSQVIHTDLKLKLEKLRKYVKN